MVDERWRDTHGQALTSFSRSQSSARFHREIFMIRFSTHSSLVGQRGCAKRGRDVGIEGGRPHPPEGAVDGGERAPLSRASAASRLTVGEKIVFAFCLMIFSCRAQQFSV